MVCGTPLISAPEGIPPVSGTPAPMMDRHLVRQPCASAAGGSGRTGRSLSATDPVWQRALLMQTAAGETAACPGIMHRG